MSVRAIVAPGFHGKLPGRGDFVQAGVPRAFVQAWDDWCQAMLAGSREALGERWQSVWLEAPIWRFRLSPGLCGPGAATGLWLPSVDRVGRYFPFTIVAVSMPDEAAVDAIFLDEAEPIGLDALALGLPPEAIATRLAQIQCPPGAPQAQGTSRWWTAGSPWVRPCSFEVEGLPGPQRYALMLDDGSAVAAPVR